MQVQAVRSTSCVVYSGCGQLRVYILCLSDAAAGLIDKVHPCEPLELGAAASDGQTFQSLISPLGVIPRNHYSPDGLMVHKLTWADLQHEPPAAVVLLRWVEWLTQLCTSTERGSCRLVLAGHNVG